MCAEVLSECIEDDFAFRREATKNEDSFLGNGVNSVTNFCIIQQQVNKLGNLDIIDRDFWLIRWSDNEVFLYCLLTQLYIPGCNSVNGTIAKIGMGKVRFDKARLIKIGFAEIYTTEVHIGEILTTKIHSTQNSLSKITFFQIYFPKIGSTQI